MERLLRRDRALAATALFAATAIVGISRFRMISARG